LRSDEGGKGREVEMRGREGEEGILGLVLGLVLGCE